MYVERFFFINFLLSIFSVPNTSLMYTSSQYLQEIFPRSICLPLRRKPWCYYCYLFYELRTATTIYEQHYLSYFIVKICLYYTIVLYLYSLYIKCVGMIHTFSICLPCRFFSPFYLSQKQLSLFDVICYCI